MKVMKSDCFAHQKFLLLIFGYQPNQNIFYQFYSFILLIVLTIYPFLVIPEIFKLYYYGNVNEFTFSLLFEFTNFTMVGVMHCIFWNRSKLSILFENLEHLDELSDFQNTGEDNVFIIPYKDLVKNQGYFGTALVFVALISYILVSVMPSLNKEKWILPFGCGAAFVNNNIQFILQVLLYGTVAILLYSHLFIYVNILTLLCGHCKLLQKYIIAAFTDPGGKIVKENNVKSNETNITDWNSFKVQLQHIIPYHMGIIDIADQIETVFSLSMLTFFGGASICMCLVLYHSEQNIAIGDLAKDIILIIVGYTLLIIISNYGEKIANESSKIANICYEIDFANCDVRIQKSLILIMVRSQRPITPTIGKFKVLGLRTMLSVFQSIYTYYTFLKNMKNE